MKELVIRAYRESDQDAEVEPWRECGLAMSWNDPRRDIYRELSTQGELLLVGSIGSKLVGTVLAGYDGYRGGTNCLGVPSDCKKRESGAVLSTKRKRALER